MREHAFSMSERALYVFKGLNGNVHVFEDRILLERRSAGCLFFFNQQSSKSIPMDSITGIQLQKPQFWLGHLGFIEFTIPGGNERNNRFDPANENAVTFKEKKLVAEAQKVHDLVLGIKKDRANPTSVATTDTTTCPFCAETIKRAATICRFCNRDLPPVMPSVATEPAVKPTSSTAREGHPFTNAPSGRSLQKLPAKPESVGDKVVKAIFGGCFGLFALVMVIGIVSPREFDPAKPAESQAIDWEKREAEADAEIKAEISAQKKQAKAPAKKPVKPQPKTKPNSLGDPLKLVAVLSEPMEFGGMECALQPEGTGWRKSRIEGWYAILRRSFGENEVSCLLESDNSSSVQHVELQAEFHEPGAYENEMLLQFAQSMVLPVSWTVDRRFIIRSRGMYAQFQAAQAGM